MNNLLKAGDSAPNFNFNTPWKTEQNLFQSLEDHSVVCVFLRYHGCPVCQMEMANLKRDIESFSDKNAKVFIVLQSSVDTMKPLLNQSDWLLEIIADPEGKIFNQYGVNPGGIIKYLHPSGLVALIKATFRGFVHKKFEGKETQLPAAFIINKDQSIKYAYYGKTISDVPSPAQLVNELK